MNVCQAVVESAVGADAGRLASWLARRSRVAVITGAGVSTGSGIPDYRDGDGNWKRSAPVQYRDFVASAAVRKRYWARSFSGWPMFAAALPGAPHQALAQLERTGPVATLVTQNVDRLHQRAGSQHVIDLHGRLDVVRCLGCRHRIGRDVFQSRLGDANANWSASSARIAPDGDADLDGVDFSPFVVPACDACGGVLKPDVVFYGEAVPREVNAAAVAAVDSADGVLVIGSSLMVWSSFRLVRAAVQRGVSVVAANRGVTRGDDLLEFKIDAECGAVLADVARTLLPPSPAKGGAKANAREAR